MYIVCGCVLVLVVLVVWVVLWFGERERVYVSCVLQVYLLNNCKCVLKASIQRHSLEISHAVTFVLGRRLYGAHASLPS